MGCNVDIWNLLHDGSIIAFSGDYPGNISLKVEIEYICEGLTPKSKFLWVHLRGCSDLTYTSFECPDVVIGLDQLEDFDLEILSAKDNEDYVSVCCTDGILRLKYEDVTCELDNGVLVTFSTLLRAYRKYWDNWEQRSTPNA